MNSQEYLKKQVNISLLPAISFEIIQNLKFRRTSTRRSLVKVAVLFFHTFPLEFKVFNCIIKMSAVSAMCLIIYN
jgi:hypothetical protein